MSALQYGILRPIPRAAQAMRPSPAAQSLRKRIEGERQPILYRRNVLKMIHANQPNMHGRFTAAIRSEFMVPSQVGIVAAWPRSPVITFWSTCWLTVRENRLEVRRGPENLHHIGVEHALLLEVMGHCVLRQKWSLEANFGPNPFAICVGLIGRVVAASPTTELRTEICALNLLEVADLAPSLVTDRAGNVDFELQDRHGFIDPALYCL